MKISVIGCGYVGAITGACLADLGNEITLVDVDQTKIDAINTSCSPIFEPGLDELLQKNHQRIIATKDLKTAVLNSNISFICVGTPSKDDGSIDLGYIESVSKEIGCALRNKDSFHTVVVKSTVFPGTSDNIVAQNIERESGKKLHTDFGIVSNPEFLREGVAVDDFFNADRIILGTSDTKSRQNIEELYSSFDCPKYFTDTKTAEMIKYVSNAFLATKISFANEIGNLCKKISIDSRDVFDGVGLDKRINPAFFNSGIGFGGSCFPKDVMALIKGAEDQFGEHAHILKSVIAVNNEQPLRLITLLEKHVPNLKGAKIGILGLAFKPETDDIRESRAIPIVKQLLDKGAEITAYDAQAANNFRELFPSVTYCERCRDVLNSDAVLILTEWQEFENMDYSGRIVIDGRRIQKAIETAGQYEGVCW
ncbi:UDP-glucose dehydrogenase family protein [Methanogenium organophilum]|uniref:UDP-glucose 6-dehydrogenase n=1 Tax=Methanogenium organophilum TaxID=2199 RepID=A0A9X9S485_METOG|nr:UDP-glucose/GDP-mannose dehydrogenase family protein [Methanogenium organophilum]WAI01192.1 UDP-glucose/GDP-mannose dehydrogenase family protein [Methanogenium organophilum]